MEGDWSDPWDVILDFLQQLPDDRRRAVADALREVVPKPTNDVTGHVSVVQQDQTSEAYGTAYPATVEIQPAVLRLLPGEVTVTPGTPPSLRRKQDRVIALMVITAVWYTALTVTTRPFSDSVRELFGQAIEVLLFGYPRR